MLRGTETDAFLLLHSFSGEGSPFAVDSSGTVQMLNRNFCHAWTTVVNLRDHVSASRHALVSSAEAAGHATRDK